MEYMLFMPISMEVKILLMGMQLSGIVFQETPIPLLDTMPEVISNLEITISLSEQIQIYWMKMALINSIFETGSMEVVAISVLEYLILRQNSILQVLLRLPMELRVLVTFSPQMHLEMPIGQLHQDDLVGDSLVMDEPIHSHNSSEQQMIKISYSREIILRHSVSLVRVEIS